MTPVDRDSTSRSAPALAHDRASKQGAVKIVV